MGLKLSDWALTKVTATGNDFIVLDLRSGASRTVWESSDAQRPRSEWVKLWCDRHQGIGADGAIFLEPDHDCDFAWDFYNSDGSSAEMCGNAARAVSLYVSQETGQSKLKFRSAVGVVDATIESPDRIEVSLPQVAESEWNQHTSNAMNRLSFDFVRAGVPHAVVRVPTLKARVEMKDMAMEIKKQERFLAEGVNVTFLNPLSQVRIEAVTYERGVEDFTLSCGTGAIAAAHSVLQGEENRPIEVEVPGGRLSVVWRNGRPHLKGPARLLARLNWVIA